MQSPEFNTNIDGFQPHNDGGSVGVTSSEEANNLIGQVILPEDKRWHVLRVEGFGEYEVQADTVDAAWLKLSYLAQDPTRTNDVGAGFKPDFHPEGQFETFLSAETLSPEQTRANNRIHRTHSVVMKSLVEYNPSPVKRYPEFAHLYMKMTQGGNVVSWDDYLGKAKPYPKVA